MKKNKKEDQLNNSFKKTSKRNFSTGGDVTLMSVSKQNDSMETDGGRVQIIKIEDANVKSLRETTKLSSKLNKRNDV